MNTIHGWSGEQIAAANRAADRDDAEDAAAVHIVTASQTGLTKPRPMTPMEHVALTMRVANRAAIGLIEDMAHPIRSGNEVLYDLRPMVDEKHWDPAIVQEHAEAITLAFEAQLIKAEPHQTGMVRIVAPQGL
jgi:hypothetical protein